MEEFGHAFSTVDTHTGGEPTRVVVDGIDTSSLGGDSVVQRRAHFEAQFDWVRELLLQEPRGHSNMFGAVPLGPGDGTDLDLFFMDQSGYLDMCGHGLIGVVTALCDTDRLDPSAVRRIGTPAGVIDVHPTVVDDRLTEVTFRNVESYVCDSLTVTVAGETVPVSVVAAGNYVVLADLAAVGATFDETPVGDLVDLGLALRAAVNDRESTDPVTGEQVAVSLAELYNTGDPANRNLVVFGDGMVDRSPCGTGTAAKLALLYDEGAIAVDESYVQESPIGTRFTGRVKQARTDDGVAVITPEITGRAYVTGEHTFYLDDRDDLGSFTFGN